MLGGLLGVLTDGSSGGTPSGGGLAAMLDMNGDGNALDDMCRTDGRF